MSAKHEWLARIAQMERGEVEGRPTTPRPLPPGFLVDIILYPALSKSIGRLGAIQHPPVEHPLSAAKGVARARCVVLLSIGMKRGYDRKKE